MIDYPLESVIEGKTSVLVPNLEEIKKPLSNFPPADAPVFYNKIMEFNRDFALATLRVYKKHYAYKDELQYCEPMAGSGIRSVRVANEIDGITVVINDLNPFAVELIKANIEHLKIQEKTVVYEEDANALMLRLRAEGTKFDIIDIDPFGSPAPFVDAAAQAISTDGLLAITSTDMATTCGVYSQACIRKYASKPIRSSIGHEISVRMLIGFIATALGRHEKSCQPVFAHSTAHYIRVYVLVKKNITKAKESMENLGYIAQCPHCLTIESSKGIINNLSYDCSNCHMKRIIGGPYWLGKIFNERFVEELANELDTENEKYFTIKKMKKLISIVENEMEANKSEKAMIGFYDLHEIADKLNLPSPKYEATINELLKKGFITTKTHFRTNSIKTEASMPEIIEAIKKVLENQFNS
ncbi:MAG TPA: tRNA (guanine(10)-N(2))-dimethyltransferase [candidate division Zixibacteria bacterium]|nr:tRNA (guanine(10)-N(2))-dimethyltransferase [candidate division Zixibacteria bacterium]